MKRTTSSSAPDGRDTQPTDRGVHLSWTVSAGGRPAETADQASADPADFVRVTFMICCAPCDVPRNTSAEAQHHAKEMDLHRSTRSGESLTRQQLLQMRKEGLARNVGPEQFLLQGLAGPVGEHGVLRRGHRFIQERDQAETGEFTSSALYPAVSACASPNATLHGKPGERNRVADRLAAGSKTLDGGEHFLKIQSQTFRPAVGEGGRHL